MITCHRVIEYTPVLPIGSAASNQYLVQFAMAGRVKTAIWRVV
jgi:hypothetical protein